MKRNNFLDVLKGYGILMVILTHFEWTAAQQTQLLFPYWMNPAVPIFMIISGYVYTESYKRKEISTFKDAYNVKGLIDKLIRYTVPMVMVYAVIIILKIFVFKQELGIKNIIVQFIKGGYGPGSYYFPFMIQFVFLFPLIYLIIKNWDFKGLVFCAVANIAYEVVKLPLDIPNKTYRLLLFRYIFAIALGCFFSMGKFKLKKWMGVVSFVIGAGFLYIVCYTDYDPIIFKWWYKTSMLAVLYITPIMYLLIKKCSFNFKPLAILGKASYNIFFAQMTIFHISNNISVLGDGSYGIAPNGKLMLITYALCIVIGLVFYKIETPITKWVLSINNKIFTLIKK